MLPKVEFPPEYEAGKTVMLKNVDAFISQMSEGETLNQIDRRFNIKNVIRTSNADKLLKIIFDTIQMADKAIEERIQIKFQRFDNKTMEKEMFVTIIPCYRCYKYDHQGRHCAKSDEYQIYSICAKVGHTYSSCKEKKERCINCQGDHRILSASCPERKKIIKNKIRERRNQSKTRKEITQNVVMEEIHKTKLPENYLVVMTAAITIAKKREAKTPGVFQYTVDEMISANSIPLVKFLETLILGYKGRQSQVRDDQNKKKRKKEKRKRKRQRSSTEWRFWGETREWKRNKKDVYCRLMGHGHREAVYELYWCHLLLHLPLLQSQLQSQFLLQLWR